MPSDHRLCEVLGEFARTMAGDFPIEPVLVRLLAQIPEVLPVEGAELVLLAGPATVAAPSGDGSTASFPLRDGNGHLGTLELRCDVGSLTDEDRRAAGTLADVVASYLLRDRARSRLRATDEATARELERASRLAAIVEWSTDAMVGTSLDGFITEWNPGAERMYGYARHEAFGRNVSMLIPSSSPDELELVLARIARREGVAHYETLRVRKDGEVFDASVSLSPIVDRDDVVVGAASVTRDISLRKAVEAEVRELQEQVHRSEHLESIGQLAGGVAHDFNNLLAAIMNYAALVSDGLADLLDRHGIAGDEAAAVVHADVAEITSVAVRAAQLTRQLLIFSHRHVTDAEVLDLNVLVAEMEGLLRQALGEGVALVLDLSPELPRTTVDRAQIEQVVMNLAVNARDAMQGRGRLRIETTMFEAAPCEAPGPARCVRLRVTDDGEGMTRAVAARVFEPFFTTKPPGQGSGLGLATVYGIAQAAGGSVEVTSEPGVGTSVLVDLPATDAEVDDAPPAVEHRTGPVAGETILLVEDEAVVREPARRLLVDAGYRVLVAPGASEAVALADAHEGELQLLLTDVVLRGRSGPELAGDLRRARPELVVLYMSGYNPELIAGRGVLDGGVKLLQKPFTSDQLRRAVRLAIDGVDVVRPRRPPAAPASPAADPAPPGRPGRPR